MSKQAQVFLEHILESIIWIQKYISGMDKKKFFGDTQVQDAVVRRLQIIGEATKYLPRPIREQAATEIKESCDPITSANMKTRLEPRFHIFRTSPSPSPG